MPAGLRVGGKFGRSWDLAFALEAPYRFPFPRGLGATGRRRSTTRLLASGS